MQSFLGTVETFTVTAAAAVPANTIVVQWSLIGVTHQSFKTGETVVAYLASRRNHYGFSCTVLESERLPLLADYGLEFDRVGSRCGLRTYPKGRTTLQKLNPSQGLPSLPLKSPLRLTRRKTAKRFPSVTRLSTPTGV